MKIFYFIFVLNFIIPNHLFSQNSTQNIFNSLQNKIESLKEQQDFQYQNLRNDLDNLRNYYNRELEIRTNEFDARLNIYLSFVFGGFAFIGFLITFFGKRSISNWIKTYSETKVSEIIEKKILELNVETVITKKSDELIDNIVLEIQSKGKLHLTELDNLKQDYVAALSSMNKMDNKKPLTEGTKISRQQFDKYEKVVDKLKDEKEFSFMDWYYKGLSEFQNFNNLKALNYWKKALDIDPKSFMILTNIGIIYNRLGQYKLSLEYYDKALAVNPKSLEPYIGKGNVYFDQGQNENAIEEYSKATDTSPDYWGAYYNRGLAYHNNGELDKALQDYDKSIQLNPTYSDNYFRKGKLFETEEDFDKAIFNYSKAIELEPVNYYYFEKRATMYFKKKEYESALNDFKKVLELQIENVSSSLSISELSLILDKPQEALDQLSELFNYPLFGDQKIIAYLFKLISEMCLNLEYESTKEQLDELLVGAKKVRWNFEDTLSWLNESKLNSVKKEVIILIINNIKK